MCSRHFCDGLRHNDRGAEESRSTAAFLALLPPCRPVRHFSGLSLLPGGARAAVAGQVAGGSLDNHVGISEIERAQIPLVIDRPARHRVFERRSKPRFGTATVSFALAWADRSISTNVLSSAAAVIDRPPSSPSRAPLLEHVAGRHVEGRDGAP